MVRRASYRAIVAVPVVWRALVVCALLPLEAVAQAQRLLADGVTNRRALEKADDALRGVLSDVDPFWVRWSAFMEGERPQKGQRGR